MPETAEAVKQTTQEKILEKELEEREDAFESVMDDLDESGGHIRIGLKEVLDGDMTDLRQLKQLASDMSSLASDLEGASDELMAVVKLAEAAAPATPVCVGTDSDDTGAFQCHADAQYLAPKREKQGAITWVPLCARHAKTWWEGKEVVGRMYVIGHDLVTP